MQKKTVRLSAIIIPEGKSYSSWCPDLDVASQGDSVEEAIANLKEALELHLECMSPVEFREVRRRRASSNV